MEAAVNRASGPGSAFVVDTTRSPHARLRPAPVYAARLNDGFWAPRLEANRLATIPSQYEQCESTGRIDNFRRASGRKQGAFQGIYFNDSDVYKWLEAAAFALSQNPDPALDATVDRVIDEIAAAQQPDGYLNTYFMFEKAKDRWTNLRDMHELYCAGHLMQAAAAHYRATGKRSLLEVAIRLADHISRVFGPDGRPGTPGHEEIEMALVELYRVTGEDRYLKQAASFIDQRGARPPVIGGSPYHQDHAPYREQSTVVGHAVRSMYLNAGAADVYAETGDQAIGAAMERLWANMTGRRMYVTGGIGSRYEGEAFGEDYELPNDRAYTETCAAIGSVFWNWRMLLASGEARFTDVMELALYNGMLAGLSLDGKEYFYQNPLENDGGHRRQPWFGCACCPPNVARMLASLPGYFYSVAEDAVWVHLYAAGSARLTLPNGEVLGLRQVTAYPWEGDITLEITEAPQKPVSLFLRVPGWSQGASITIGQDQTKGEPGAYHRTDRVWNAGDKVTLSLPMPVEILESHPHLSGNTGQGALCRGPLVYCVEEVDNPGVDIRNLRLKTGAAFRTEHRPDLLGGVTLIRAQASHIDPRSGSLYRRAQSEAVAGSENLTAVPYYAWANRAPGRMRVWIPFERTV